MNAQLVPRADNLPVAQTTTPADLLAIAVSQNADIDKLTKLMDLQERFEANEARKAFTVAMTGFKSEPVEILKKKNVSFSGTSYNHAELSDITDAIGAALSRHALSYRWDVRQDAANSITVDCILTHIAGHSERVTMTAPPDDSGKKNKIQQIASSTTYLQRYTLLAVTGMSTKGMDDDGRGATPDDTSDLVDDWRDAIMDAADKSELDRLAEQLKTAKIPDAALKAIRSAWAARAKELAA